MHLHFLKSLGLLDASWKAGPLFATSTPGLQFTVESKQKPLARGPSQSYFGDARALVVQPSLGCLGPGAQRAVVISHNSALSLLAETYSRLLSPMKLIHPDMGNLHKGSGNIIFRHSTSMSRCLSALAQPRHLGGGGTHVRRLAVPRRREPGFCTSRSHSHPTQEG